MDKKFPHEVEEYFLPFEDNCSLSFSCAGRVTGVLEHAREKVLKAPVVFMIPETLWS